MWFLQMQDIDISPLFLQEEKTGYFDKTHTEIKEHDILFFDNGSVYEVRKYRNKFVIKHLDNRNVPLMLLSKITFGNILCGATIVR